MNTIDKNYNQCWKQIVENPDGSLNKDQIKKELFDFSQVMRMVPIVYDHITNGRITNIMTVSDDVISEADHYYSTLEKE